MCWLLFNSSVRSICIQGFGSALRVDVLLFPSFFHSFGTRGGKKIIVKSIENLWILPFKLTIRDIQVRLLNRTGKCSVFVTKSRRLFVGSGISFRFILGTNFTNDGIAKLEGIDDPNKSHITYVCYDIHAMPATKHTNIQMHSAHVKSISNLFVYFGGFSFRLPKRMVSAWKFNR